MLLVHAIGPAEEAQAGALPAARVRPDWPVQAVGACGLVAWASLADDPAPLGRDALVAHHRLAEQALAAGLCLPVRFPTWVADEQALRELLARLRDALLAALEHVRGRVELAVTVTWTTPEAASQPVSASSPGTRYLHERRKHYAQADQRRAEAERLANLLEADERVVEARHTVCPSPEIGLSSALLAANTDALAVAERLRGLGESVRILVNGPWPPYSFVSLEG